MGGTEALGQLLTDLQLLPHYLLPSRVAKHGYPPRRATMCSRDRTLSFSVKASHLGRYRVQNLARLKGSSQMTELSSFSPSCSRRVAAVVELETMRDKADVLKALAVLRTILHSSYTQNNIYCGKLVKTGR